MILGDTESMLLGLGLDLSFVARLEDCSSSAKVVNNFMSEPGFQNHFL